MAKLAGEHLIDGDAGPNARGALVQANTGQERATAARVIAGTVRPRLGRLVIQAAEDLNERLASLQRLKRTAKLEVGTFARGPPGGRNGAVGEEDESGAERRSRGGGGQRATDRRLGEELGGAQRAKERQS